MARGKRQTKIIQVKAAPTNNCDVINLVKLAKKSQKNTCKPDMVKLSPEITEFDAESLDVSSTLATSETAKDYVMGMKQITPSPDNMKRALEDDFIEVQLKMEGPADNAAAVLEPDMMIVGDRVREVKDDKDMKKEKKVKKKKNKKKKKKQKCDADTEATVQESEVKRPVKLAPIKTKKETTEEESHKAGVRVLKNTGCFGFVSTWLAKRKEKRREKKRKAIAARKTKSGESLVVYDSWVAKGGVAFTVEMDSRPMSVLPPIRQRPGPIRMATEEKLESADNKRSSHINKKIEAARAHSRLVKEVADRRAQNERNFKQTKSREKEVKLQSADTKRSRHINKKIETARAHSRQVKEVADKRAQNEWDFKQTTLEKLREKDDKLESADNKKSSHINRNIETARAHSRLVKEVTDRRAQNERDFKQTTLDKLRDKEDKAFRATSRLQYAREQRCRTRLASRMENTPDIPASRIENSPDMLASKLESIALAQSTPRMDGATPLSPACSIASGIESDIVPDIGPDMYYKVN